MSQPDYQKKFGIVTKRVVLAEIHGAIRGANLLPEYEDIIIATNSMSIEEWRRMTVFSWTLMVMHSLKLGFFVFAYLADRYNIRFVDILGYFSDLNLLPDDAGIWRGEVEEFHRQIDLYLEGK